VQYIQLKFVVSDSRQIVLAASAGYMPPRKMRLCSYQLSAPDKRRTFYFNDV